MDRNVESGLKYQLDDRVPFGENMMYGFQQIVLFVASAVVMPVVVGYALGLAPAAVAAMLQRTFVLCGVMTLLQVRWGHRDCFCCWFPPHRPLAFLWRAFGQIWKWVCCLQEFWSWRWQQAV